MAITEKMRAAQADIITRLASGEQAISALYAFFSDYFPVEKDFWKRLAQEEQKTFFFESSPSVRYSSSFIAIWPQWGQRGKPLLFVMTAAGRQG